MKKDLGVRVSAGLRKQCIEAINKANKVLGYIFRSVKSRSPEVILQLYLALVIPQGYRSTRISAKGNV